jgi:hypothetical protein
MNCFAAGVFLAMALVHIQPESVESYIAIRKEGCPGFEKEEGHHRRMLRSLD